MDNTWRHRLAAPAGPRESDRVSFLGGEPGDRDRLSYGLCARHRRRPRLAGQILLLATLTLIAMIGWIIARGWLGLLPQAEQAWTAGGALLAVKMLLPVGRSVRVDDRLCRGCVRLDRRAPAFVKAEATRGLVR